MTTDELRAAADELVGLHGRFAPLFGRVEAREHSFAYLHGLLSAHGRKSVEPMALVFGDGSNDDPVDGNVVIRMQRFITASPWKWNSVQCEIQKVFAEQFAPSAADWPVGTIGVIDESGFPKKGKESVGVARQYCGRLGGVENCQVGVFLIGTVPAGTALLDHELYLPKSWIKDRARRKKTRVPKKLKFRTKPEIALQLLQRSVTGPVQFDWIIADEEYGRNGAFLDGMEALSQKYVVEVPVNTTVWTVDPEGRGRPPGKKWRAHVHTVQSIGDSLPVEAWQNLKLREGAVGPLVFQFARVRVWAVRHRKPGPPVWLLIRRSLDGTETKYFLVNASAEEPL